MAIVGKTPIIIRKNDNGSYSIFKGGRFDSSYFDKSDLNARVKELKEVGYGKKLTQRVIKIG